MPPSAPGSAAAPGNSLPRPRSVLIVRPTALGDVSRTVPALVVLRQALPEARIDWLVHDAFADAIRHHPALSGVVPFPRERFAKVGRSPAALREFLAWARTLRRQRYDLAIDLQGLLRSGLFTWLTRAPRRVGFANARELGWLGYNRRHFVDEKIHAVDRMLALLKAEGFDAAQPDMRLYIGAQEKDWLARFLEAQGLHDEPYFIIAPTARWRSKCWPLDRYMQITRRLLDAGIAGRRGIVLASPKERAQVQPLLDAFAQSDHASGVMGQPKLLFPATTVGQMMALLSQTRLLICNDSAPLHMAVGFARPIVTIFGPTDPAQVGPYRREACIVRPDGAIGFHRDRNDQSLISQVGVEAVWAKALEQLQFAD